MADIVAAYPPNYKLISQKFPVKGRSSVVFAYGDAIYNPGARTLPNHLVCHELTHLTQQKEYGGADKWWEQYLDDDQFRLEQEIEAYQAQYQFLKDHHSREERRHILGIISRDLSGPLYGRLVTRKEAEALIKEGVTGE